MNPRILLAFALGVLVASGVTYYASRPQAAGPVEQPKTPVQPPTVIYAPAPHGAEPTPAPVASNVPDEPAPRPAKSGSKGFSKPAPYERASAAVPDSPRPSAPEKQQASTNAPYTPPVNQPIIMQDPPAPPPAAPVEAPKSAPAVAVRAPEPPKANVVTIPAGTTLTVRLQEKLSSERNQAGDTFNATLDQPVVIDGFVIAERGARVLGRVAEIDRAGKVKGLARLVLQLTQVNTTDGQRVKIQTSPFERKADSTTKKDAAKVGIGAAIGAAIGGIAGGGKGAATGAGVGGAAGAGQVLLTRGEAAELNVEARLSFRLQEAITITEQLNN